MATEQKWLMLEDAQALERFYDAAGVLPSSNDQPKEQK